MSGAFCLASIEFSECRTVMSETIGDYIGGGSIEEEEEWRARRRFFHRPIDVPGLSCPLVSLRIARFCAWCPTFVLG
jgi:hypothetical protein